MTGSVWAAGVSAEKDKTSCLARGWRARANEMAEAGRPSHLCALLPPPYYTGVPRRTGTTRMDDGAAAVCLLASKKEGLLAGRPPARSERGSTHGRLAARILFLASWLQLLSCDARRLFTVKKIPQIHGLQSDAVLVTVISAVRLRPGKRRTAGLLGAQNLVRRLCSPRRLPPRPRPLHPSSPPPHHCSRHPHPPAPVVAEVVGCLLHPAAAHRPYPVATGRG
jgi:hypothetical protein